MWDLIHYKWCHYKKRRLEHRHTGKTGSRQAADVHLQAEQRALRRNQTCRQLDIGLTCSRTVRKEICCVRKKKKSIACMF